MAMLSLEEVENYEFSEIEKYKIVKIKNLIEQERVKDSSEILGEINAIEKLLYQKKIPFDITTQIYWFKLTYQFCEMYTKKQNLNKNDIGRTEFRTQNWKKPAWNKSYKLLIPKTKNDDEF